MGEDLKILKRFLPYIFEYKGKIALAIVGMIFAAIGTSASAYLVKPILDEIFINKDAAMLKILPPLVILMYFLKGFGKFIQVYYTEFVGQDIIRRIRQQMLASILAMPYAYFVKQPSGELISRLTNDINRIKTVVANLLPDMLRESLIAIALVFVVIYQSPKLALYFLIIMPLAIYPLSRLAKRMKKASHKSQEKISDLTTHLTEIFNNIELIKAEAREKIELQRFHNYNKDFFKLTMKQIRISNFVSPFMELLGAIIIAIVIYVGGHEVLEGRMSTGQFFSFMTALFMLYGPIKRISSIYNQIQDAIAAAERIFTIIDLIPTIRSGNIKLTSAKKLCFENVSLTYDDKSALANISFCAPKDSITAIVGESGSGKSSIVSLVLRFYDPTTGRITIDGVDLKSFDLENLRQNIAFVTQRIYLFQASIAENVAGSESFNEEKVIDVLKRADAWNFVQNLPQGIYTKLSEAGANLSGGQRQRLAIARALYKNAKILIFDEATSALDKKSEMAILQTIRQITKDKIVLLISHNIGAITFADQILFLDRGKILCKGKHEELLQECPAYRQLFHKGK